MMKREVFVENKQTINGMRRARKLALQALYQWHMSGTELCEIEAQFRAVNDMQKVDTQYFCRLLHSIPAQLSQIEDTFMPFLDRPLQGLNPIELTVLRLSSYELLHCPEIPYRVVLDESVTLAKTFGSQDGHRYVNGVLNNVAKIARATEISLG